MNNILGKLKVISCIIVDILYGICLGIVLGVGAFCLIPLLIIAGAIFMIWVLIDVTINNVKKLISKCKENKKY